MPTKSTKTLQSPPSHRHDRLASEGPSDEERLKPVTGSNAGGEKLLERSQLTEDSLGGAILSQDSISRCLIKSPLSPSRRLMIFSYSSTESTIVIKLHYFFASLFILLRALAWRPCSVKRSRQVGDVDIELCNIASAALSKPQRSKIDAISPLALCALCSFIQRNR